MRHLRFRLAVLLALAVAIAGPSPVRAQSADELSALNTQVNQLYQAGKFSEGQAIAQQALALAEARLDGPDRPHGRRRASATSPLLHLAQGRYSDAEPIYERTLGIREKALGAEHPDVAASTRRSGELPRRAEATMPRPSRSTTSPRDSRKGLGETIPTWRTLNNLAVPLHARAATRGRAAL